MTHNMVNILLGCVLGLTMSCTSGQVKTEPEPVVNPGDQQVAGASSRSDDGFEIHRGVNLECWFSQIGNRTPDPEYYTPETIRQLKQWGFDHIRLCVGEEKIYDNKLNPIENNWKLLYAIMDECVAQDMRIIFDLHESRDWDCNHTDVKHVMFSDYSWLIKTWTEALHRDLAKYPNNVLAYDIINEPASSALTNPKYSWNEIATAVIKAIREVEPNRTLVVCGDNWANPGENFLQLNIPADPHVIASVHFYQPNNLCFYREPWGKYAEYDGPIHYPGYILQRAEWNKWLREWKEANPGKQPLTDFTNWCNDRYDYSKMHRVIKECKEHCDQLGIKFMLGEFGTTFYLASDVRNAWYTDVVKVCDELGVPYSNWGVKGAFGLYDWNGKGPERNVFDTDLTKPNTTLINILTGKGNSGIRPIYVD